MTPDSLIFVFIFCNYVEVPLCNCKALTKIGILLLRMQHEISFLCETNTKTSIWIKKIIYTTEVKVTQSQFSVQYVYLIWWCNDWSILLRSVSSFCLIYVHREWKSVPLQFLTICPDVMPDSSMECDRNASWLAFLLETRLLVYRMKRQIIGQMINYLFIHTWRWHLGTHSLWCQWLWIHVNKQIPRTMHRSCT